MDGASRFPAIQQSAAHIRILHPQRAVQIPGKRDAALASTRFIGRQSRLQARIVNGLHLPRDDAVFDADLPTAGPCAVDSVRAPNDLVMLPAVAIELLPIAQRGILFVFYTR